MSTTILSPFKLFPAAALPTNIESLGTDAEIECALANLTGVISGNHTLEAAQNRMVVVFVGHEGYLADATIIPVVTYGGVTMHLATTAAQTSGTFGNRASIFYLLDAELPANGSNSVVSTLTGYADNDYGMYVRAYKNVVQEFPEDVDAMAESSPADAIIENSITCSQDSWILSMSICGNPTTGTFSYNESQVEVLNGFWISPDGAIIGISEKRNCAANTYSLTSTYSASGTRYNRAAIAIRKYYAWTFYSNPTNGFKSDNFSSGIIQPHWSEMDTNGGASISVSGGNAVMAMPAAINHDMWTATGSYYLFQDVVAGEDFDLSIKVPIHPDLTAAATTPYNRYAVGLIYYKSDDTAWIATEIMAHESGPRMYHRWNDSGVGTGTSDTATLDQTAVPTWVRMKKVGTTFTMYLSLNGSTWEQTYSRTMGTGLSSGGNKLGFYGLSWANPATGIRATNQYVEEIKETGSAFPT